ncbi:MAG: serine/threonine-protein phosphatase [Clostridiales bacterium]|nr:serine/threonine-protein phosphatase [Clostridiales bacterium]
MMNNGAYKKILNAMPEGVFVFDDNLRVKFTNVAFRRSVSEEVKPSGTLSDVVGCREQNGCGENAACEYCAFYRAMKGAVAERVEKTETLQTTVKRAGHTDKLSLRIRVLPADNKGKLFLGITDGSYQTEIERDMLSAKQMQQRLLPAGKSMGGVNYSFMYIPCLGVGGDLPDVYELNGNTYGVLADVSGKGVSAGMLSAFVKAGLDRQEPDLAKALSQLNVKFNELHQDERSYITVAAVRIDKKTQKLRYVMAGHNAPILLKNDFGIHEIESVGMPISNWVDNVTYEEKELPFEKGDLLVLLTDGVTECMNAKGELFGIERTESVLMQSHGAEDFIGKLKTALGVFSGGKFSDDITAIAFDL